VEIQKTHDSWDLLSGCQIQQRQVRAPRRGNEQRKRLAQQAAEQEQRLDSLNRRLK